MIKKEIEIAVRDASKEDAPFIAETIMEALGHDLCVGLAEGENNLGRVRQLFTELSAREDSQYSYLNTLVAIDRATGNRVGAIISYDGARLRELRRAFIDAANRLLGWNVTVKEADKWEPEAEAGEVYLDSLYVVDAFRRHGVGATLIRKAMERHSAAAKPYGLLVEPDNIKGLSLYKALGFRPVGTNNFCGTPMLHFQYKNR